MRAHGRFSQHVRRFLLVTCAIAWLAEFVATHIPAGKLPVTYLSDKTLHFLCYLALSSLLLLTMAAYGLRCLRRVLTVTCAVMTYAMADELTQPLTGRQAAFGDWLADIAGALAAIVALEVIFYILARRTIRIERTSTGDESP